jgi:hypothetical protein
MAEKKKAAPKKAAAKKSSKPKKLTLEQRIDRLEKRAFGRVVG